MLADPFTAHPLGIVMEGNPLDPMEVEGVLNPATARGPDGELYLFPRLVSRGNFSRIGIARVLFDKQGDPTGVERLGVALEPRETYERNPYSGGGCEDPRITFVAAWGCYVMTYTAFSEAGPRIAMAASHDLRRWDRLGLVTFEGRGTMDFSRADNKDALLFPQLVPDPRDGVMSMALIHRPLVRGHSRAARRPPSDTAEPPSEPLADREAARLHERLNHQSIWISYADPSSSPRALHFHSHRRLMSPRSYWERVKVGGGAPPLLTDLGWLVIYHGVHGRERPFGWLRYSAGVAILDAQAPERVCFRTRHPILVPPNSHEGIVFPTGVDCRTDIGCPRRLDVYYGIGDVRIGVASLLLPDELPPADDEAQHQPSRDQQPAAEAASVLPVATG